MTYDTVTNTNINEYSWNNDYCRFRALELIAEEIQKNDVIGSIAEAGVGWGDFAKIINRIFPDRKFYLYDTFEGFDEKDKKIELEKGYTSEKWFRSNNEYRGEGAEKNIEKIRGKMKHLEKCEFRRGYFPDSAIGESEERFAFVSIDMDLYEPIFAALHFFYPRLNKGGYIFLHDYNHNEFSGVKVAVDNFEKSNGRITKVPLPDQGGTLIIAKSM
jgi:hypothetical protein